MDKPEDFLQQLLNIGALMISVGSEVKRVEDTLSRMGLAYGAEDMSVFAINTNIIITMTLFDKRIITQTRRVHASEGTDFLKLEQLNNLSRFYCAAPFSVKQIEAELSKIEKQKPKKLSLYLGSALAAGSFAVFFGGTAADCIAGIIVSALICYLQEHLEPFCNNKTIFNFLASLIAGIVISAIVHCFPIIHTSHVTIGVIMLLVPGIAMTNAIRNIWLGDTITGVMRLIETLLWTGGLACGFMISFLLGG